MKRTVLSIFVFSVLVGFSSLMLNAQGDRKMNINEFLVFNETNFIDDYGNHCAWIELFNPAYNSVNISKMYLTNDPQNPKMYRIPDAGNLTVIQPRGFVVFYADNHPTFGVFHTNFILDSTGYIGIYDSDGKTLLDEIYYPIQNVDVTYGRTVDGGETWTLLEFSTPSSSNVTDPGETSAEMFNRLDSSGFALTLISMLVVFGALILLYFMYRLSGYLNQKSFTVKVKVKNEKKGEPDTQSEVVLSSEVNAAIALGIHLFVEQAHDFENTTITLKKISRPYSPWSSKIYGIRNNPEKS